jgi:UDP-N-acetyl-2-amino-2-deoxyglucuronate dehydrogenase
MGDAIRVGLIGGGFIAEYHLAGLAAAGGAEVPVLATRTPARAAGLARRFAIPEVVADYRALLERRDVDAVVIATPDDTHETMAVAAAGAGKAILLQKPMARSAAECRRIIAAARRAGVDLQVSFMHRHFEETVRARELLGEGRLGPVLGVRMRNATPGPDWGDWFFSRERVPGGVVHQLGIHGIDLLRHLVGDIAAVSAMVATLRPERALADGRRVRVQNADHAHALYRLQAGGLATHEMSLVETAGCDRFRLEVYCADGTLWLRTERGPLALHGPALTGAPGWLVPDLPAPPPGARQHARWLDILRGRLPSDPTAEDGLASVLVAEAIARAAAAGREVTVEPVDS